MKASQLISRLALIIEHRGDLDVDLLIEMKGTQYEAPLGDIAASNPRIQESPPKLTHGRIKLLSENFT